MRRIRIMLVVVGVVALVGGGTALAEKSRGSAHQGTPVGSAATYKLPARAGRFGFGCPRFPGLEVVTSYLGIDNADLLTQLRAGKTLAQIADGTSGRSASGLIAALVADAKRRFGSNAPLDLEQRITDLVNGVHANARPGSGGPPFGPRNGGHGFLHRGGSSI